jgi:hypothetical protein
MTAGGRVPLAVHVCTRNRSRSVRVLLADLGTVLDGFDARVTVYDDSTSTRSRDACRAACGSAPIPVRYFGEAERRALVASAAGALPSARECLEVSRPLGSPGWDLAGVRFTAMLDAGLDPGSTAHLFLDDDIRVAPCSYAGDRFDVDPVALGDALRTVAEGDDLLAAGAPFLGRADLSALEHFEAFLDGVPGRAPPVARAGSPPSFPVVVTSVPHVHPDSPGISGGFLLTTTRALRTVPLARSYNEDWIWLRQLIAAGGTIREIGVAVVHAGPTRFRLSTEGLFLQFEGEVLDLTLASNGGSAAPAARHSQDAFQACADRLETVLRKARHAESAAPDLAPAVAVLVGARARVRGAAPLAYASKLGEHLRRTRLWKEAFAALGSA